MPIGPTVSDTEHEVRGQQRRVAVTVRGLQTDHACGEAVIVRDGAPAHQRRDDRHVEDLGELHEQVGRVGVDDASAGHDQRALGSQEHVDGLLSLSTRGDGLVHGQRLVRLGIEVDLGQLHVDGQIDQHRTGATGAHQMERLREGTGNLSRLEHRHRHLGDGCRDRRDVDGLEVLLVQPRHRGLAGDGEDRNRVGHGRIQPGDHVGAGRTGGTDADSDVARCGPGEALRHVRGTFDVAGQHVADATVTAHRRVEGIDGRTGETECGGRTFEFEDLHCGIGRTHPGHVSCPCL